jgi:hypothetical protein
VDGVDHLLPAGERFIAPEQRDVGVVGGALAAGERAFGEDEADFVGRAALVIADVFGIGESARETASGSWGP